MEDDLKFVEKGGWPQIYWKRKMTTNLMEMEHNLNFVENFIFIMEDDLNILENEGRP